MINEQFNAPRTAYSRTLLISFAVLLVASFVYCAHLFWRVDRAIGTTSGTAPAAGRLIDLRGRTNAAVQECLAYVIAGDDAKRAEFEQRVADLGPLSESFLKGTMLDERSRERFESVVQSQQQLVASGRRMIDRYERVGGVEPADFRAFERDVDRFREVISGLLGRLNAAHGSSHDEVASVLAQTRIESALLGCVFLGLSTTLLVLVVRRFRDYDRLREEALNRVLESNQRFRLIFDSEPHCVKLVDRAGSLVDINPAGLQSLEAERDDVLGKCIFDVISEGDRKRFIESTQEVFEGESNSLEFEIIGLKGRRRTMTTRQVPIRYGGEDVVHVLAITEDVTEKRRIERQLKHHRDKLAHASRVNLLGELVSSIAHELNQPLSAATNYAFVLEKLSTESPLKAGEIEQHAASIRQQAERAAEIVRGIRSLLKPNENDNEETDIHQLIESSLGIMGPDLRGHGVDVNLQFHAESLTVSGNQVQLQQVLMNLFQNAVQAMDQVQRERRQLTIRTSSTADEVEIRVEDRGNGIRSEDTKTVFRTFYTTKPEGMGMGLAVARSIIEAHEGSLVVEESTSGGTVFLVVLPLSGEPVHECYESQSLGG
ncbi:Sensor protein FixL [Stieleria maiorica]|uniref:histidine kinase n=1 Tax=Stieleria maiorica TaxID=2795974 RepID=A0A5B9MSF7_9BACT|nr:ATP-binding protein [Stieleria maiorica]QEG01948.1 Sensor protein FixL [Stieleria maiorica]